MCTIATFISYYNYERKKNYVQVLANKQHASEKFKN